MAGGGLDLGGVVLEVTEGHLHPTVVHHHPHVGPGRGRVGEGHHPGAHEAQRHGRGRDAGPRRPAPVLPDGSPHELLAELGQEVGPAHVSTSARVSWRSPRFTRTRAQPSVQPRRAATSA